jgi:hypothetical protein
VSDLGKIGVIAGIMGALLLFGLLFTPTQPAEERDIVTVEEPVATEVVVLPSSSIEMLDPIYSEKAVFQDDTIRIAFDITQTKEGVESQLSFWLHNISDDPINVLWDRCSIQLPGDNTVNIINEGAVLGLVASDVISIAPAGDLFEAVIPVTEIDLSDPSAPVLSVGVLDQGTFTFVLAIERGADCAGTLVATPVCEVDRRSADGCDDRPAVSTSCQMTCTEPCYDREIIYYTFRFVIR